MSRTMDALNALRRRDCSLCGGLGWKHLGEGECYPCLRCLGTGTPSRPASPRVMVALRGARTPQEMAAACERLSLEPPTSTEDAYACGLHDGETAAAAAALVVLLMAWGAREERAAA